MGGGHCVDRFLQRLCQYEGTIFLGLPLEGEAKKDAGQSPISFGSNSALVWSAGYGADG